MSSQTEKDTARNKSKQNGGDGGTSERMSQREAAAGLNLAGNDTMSGRGQPMPTMSEREAAAGLNLSGNDTMSGRGKPMPTFAEREAAAGLNLAGNNTISGRDDFYNKRKKFNLAWSSFDSSEVLAGSPMDFKADVPSGGGGGELYAFKVVDDGDGTVSVTTGTVNTETATGLTPTGKPDELWLEVTFSATTGEVTAAAIETASSAVSETNDSRQIATITWGGENNNTPTIVQGIKGSQSIASCGATHQWGTLYS